MCEDWNEDVNSAFYDGEDVEDLYYDTAVRFTDIVFAPPVEPDPEPHYVHVEYCTWCGKADTFVVDVNGECNVCGHKWEIGR